MVEKLFDKQGRINESVKEEVVCSILDRLVLRSKVLSEKPEKEDAESTSYKLRLPDLAWVPPYLLENGLLFNIMWKPWIELATYCAWNDPKGNSYKWGLHDLRFIPEKECKGVFKDKRALVALAISVALFRPVSKGAKGYIDTRIKELVWDCGLCSQYGDSKCLYRKKIPGCPLARSGGTLSKLELAYNKWHAGDAQQAGVVFNMLLQLYEQEYFRVSEQE